MAKTPIAALLRVGWDTVGAIVARVVCDRLDESRLSGRVQIGVDEVSFRRGERYLTCVADHATGSIPWIRPGRNPATLQAFFDKLGPECRTSIRAVSIDMSAGYENAVRAAIPAAEVAFDPSTSHSLRAAPSTRSTARSARAGQVEDEGRQGGEGRALVAPTRGSRAPVCLPARGPGRRPGRQPAPLRAFILKEELRALYTWTIPARPRSCSKPGSPGLSARSCARS